MRRVIQLLAVSSLLILIFASIVILKSKASPVEELYRSNEADFRVKASHALDKISDEINAPEANPLSVSASFQIATQKLVVLQNQCAYYQNLADDLESRRFNRIIFFFHIALVCGAVSCVCFAYLFITRRYRYRRVYPNS